MLGVKKRIFKGTRIFCRSRITPYDVITSDGARRGMLIKQKISSSFTSDSTARLPALRPTLQTNTKAIILTKSFPMPAFIYRNLINI